MAKNSKTEEEFSCFCSKSPAEFNLAKGCEVSAVLHHGSYVRWLFIFFYFQKIIGMKTNGTFLQNNCYFKLTVPYQNWSLQLTLKISTTWTYLARINAASFN